MWTWHSGGLVHLTKAPGISRIGANYCTSLLGTASFLGGATALQSLNILNSFSDLGLIEPLRRAVVSEGYTTPTPIQAKAIPHAIKGRDVQGVAQTGTGKTAAFILPVLQKLAISPRKSSPNKPRTLILTPTRELAIQIGASIQTYGRYLSLRHTVVYGGVSQHPQVKAMRRGVDILVATPGRLLDLINQGHIELGKIEIFILDEADRMLDMGFIHDIRKITASIPKKRQTLFFSATMPHSITKLTRQLLYKPELIEIQPAVKTAERVNQSVLFVNKGNKRELLHQLFSERPMDRTLVFTRTKHGANRLAKYLGKRGIGSDAIHGNKSQSARQKALKRFRNGRVQALVATDVASRGIDVDQITHVVNFDLPNQPESYVHRIGRTGRAGAAGEALSFCDAGEVSYLKDIERKIRETVAVDGEHRYHCDRVAGMYANSGRRKSGKRGSGRRSRRR